MSMSWDALVNLATTVLLVLLSVAAREGVRRLRAWVLQSTLEARLGERAQILRALAVVVQQLDIEVVAGARDENGDLPDAVKESATRDAMRRVKALVDPLGIRLEDHDAMELGVLLRHSVDSLAIQKAQHAPPEGPPGRNIAVPRRVLVTRGGPGLSPG